MLKSTSLYWHSAMTHTWSTEMIPVENVDAAELTQ